MVTAMSEDIAEHMLQRAALIMISATAALCKVYSVQFSSFQLLSRVRLFATSTPGLPVHHQLPEFTQTHVRRVGDAILGCFKNRLR